MGQLTVQQFQIKTDEQGNPKKDNYGNTQMMIKFAENPETVYKAVKDPSSVTEGKVMYGQIVEGQYGFKFQADPYNQPGQSQQPSQPFSSPAQQTQLPVASNDAIIERLDAIYKAVTGEEYSGVKKETTSTDIPPVDAYNELPEPDFGEV